MEFSTLFSFISHFFDGFPNFIHLPKQVLLFTVQCAWRTLLFTAVTAALVTALLPRAACPGLRTDCRLRDSSHRSLVPRPAASTRQSSAGIAGHYSVLAFAVTIITLQFTSSLSPRPGPRYHHPRSSCSENDACCAKLDLTRARMTHYFASSI